MKLAALTLTLLTVAISAQAITLEKVDLPAEHQVNGQELKLNGAGIRTATFLKVKVYVAAFYSPATIETPEQAFASEGPLRFDFTFLRSFPKAKVVEAWNFTFDESASHIYPELKNQTAAFSEFFGPIKKFGVESVEIEGEETRVYDDGALKGTIKGKDFQKTFLSLWFGSKPVMDSLKKALLAGEPQK